MSLDTFAMMRSALMTVTGVTSVLDQYLGEPAIFTRRPVPADAPSKICIINPPSSINGDNDGVSKGRPTVTHDIVFYGKKGAPGSAEDETREIEAAAYAAREHFHRNRFSVQPSGYYVIDVVVGGPVPAPVDGPDDVGRVITVTLRMGESS